MKIDDIPPDVDIKMTTNLIRAFESAGCHPACHNCGTELIDGMVFKLAYVKNPLFYAGWTLKRAFKQADSTDEMLCDTCTADDLIKSRTANWNRQQLDYEDRINHRGNYRGYTRKHKLARGE